MIVTPLLKQYINKKEMIKIERELSKEKNSLLKLIDIAKKEIQKLPTGNLRCTKSNGTYQYYIDGKYVSKKKAGYVSKIARQNYLKNLLITMEREVKILSEAEEYYRERKIDSVYDSLCIGRKKLFEPINETITQKIEKFMSLTYDPMEFKESDVSEYYTNNDERVRSKSEKLIADELLAKAIPYKYEMPLRLENKGYIVTLRPDFTVLNKRNGKIYIMEHMGMMDNPEYIEKAMDKLSIYEKNGYLLGDKLIILHETSTAPLNTKVMKSYIDVFFT